MAVSASANPDPIGRAPILSEQEQWQAVQAKDRSYDGRFVFAVETTGVYCRPSCPAKPALRRNVSFHATPEAARQAGFRPCKRCDPNGPSPDRRRVELVEQACRTIEAAEEAPALADLALAAGLSPFHFHRLFKSVTGLTPKAYALAARGRRMRQALAGDGTITQAIYEAGYGSSSRFYEGSAQLLGMTARAYRKGGEGETIRFAIASSSLGPLLVAATERGLCRVAFGDEPEILRRDLERCFAHATLADGDEAFQDLVARVVALVEQPRAHDLPLDLRGTAFQQRVWQALSSISLGATATYTEIAQAIGNPTATRAVAGACAANPVAVAVPCHRVLRSDGSLSGYRWGVARKQALLEREGARKSSDADQAR